MKSVTVDELREKLDEVIAELKPGESVTVTRDGTEIARIDGPPQRGVPYPFRDLQITPIGKHLADEAVRILIEDRDEERLNKKYGL